MDEFRLNFRHRVNDEDLVIAVAQDYETSEVLMVAYMNKEALERTLDSGKAHYWSTSRGKLWLKGESSKNYQLVQEVFTDCDQDAVVLKVRQLGGACHKGYYSCFFRKISEDKKASEDKSAVNKGILGDKEFKLDIIKDKIFEPEEIYGGR